MRYRLEALHRRFYRPLQSVLSQDPPATLSRSDCGLGGSGYLANRSYFPVSRKLSMNDLISGSFNGLISSFESPATS